MTITLRCILYRGAFSGEKVYTVVLAGGEPWQSLVPIAHCWHLDWRPIAPNEPAEPIDALVECRITRRNIVGPSDLVMVDVPNHTESVYVWVKPKQLIQRPQETLSELLARRPGAK